MKYYLLNKLAALGAVTRLGNLFRNGRKSLFLNIILLFIPSGFMAALFIGSFLSIALPAHKESLITSKKEMIKELTNAVWMLLSNYDHRVQSGELSIEEAQSRAKARIRSMSYGGEGKDYFWILDAGSRMIMHPYRPELEGRTIEELGYNSIQDIMDRSTEMVKSNNSGYIQYNWQKYESRNNTSPKLAYVKEFQAWNWIIGTGIYMDDINKKIDLVVRKLIYAHIGIFMVVAILSIYIIWRSKTEETKRIEAENSLKQSEQRFRSLVETSSDLIWEMDAKGVFTYMSPRIMDHLGYQPAEITGYSLHDLLPPDEVNRLADAYLIIRETGEPIIGLENIIHHKNGEPVFLETNCVAINDHKKGFNGVRGTTRNITSRKQAQKEVMRLQNLTSTIFDSTPSALLSIDEELRITKWNQNALKFLNGSDGLECGKAITQVYPHLSFDHDRIKHVVLGLLQKIIRNVEWRDADQIRHLNVMVYPLFSKDFKGAVLRIDDITEQMRMEEIMIQSEKMISLGGLVAGMAHEINNPLGGILNGSQNLQRRLLPDFDKNISIARKYDVDLTKLQGYLQERKILRIVDGIRDSAVRAADIITNMLQFARKSDSTKNLSDMVEIVNSAIDIAGSDWDLKKRYDFQSIEIIKQFETALPLVPCNKIEIAQVLLNLFKNAAHALRIASAEKSPRITIRIAAEQKMIRLEIEDNGTGMEATVCKRVFEPFFTTKPAGTGTGLGLAISYMIISRYHNGMIEVESEPGIGTKFVIRLPLDIKLS
ncbi:cache domain-containing protein [bacterium]|nr:cache domain-containing protein [bacterium]